ncbi:MAG: amidohydrolase family protein [Gemmatimonadota bacterium]|nr:MAG: amidohydrolase family protein [Gemmatimonadota bacterium]
MRYPSISAETAWGQYVRHRLLPRLAAPVLLAAALAVLPAAAAGQAPSAVPNPPPYYAITNARIVTVSGPVIESGTVVIANGLIAAVGTNVDMPPEAWVIDGEGLTVYPGLFDALSDLGLEEAQTGAAARMAAAAPTGARAAPAGPENRLSTFTWRAAADELTTDDSRIATWREGGFTTAMTIHGDGLVTGQGAVVSLADGAPQQMVVKTPAALRLTLRSQRGFRSYPSSLFGVMAYQKQLFLDADRYARAMAADRARAAGLDRPAYDRTLEPVGRAVAERWPVLIPGDEVKEIRRAMVLGDAFGVRTVVYGARQGHQVAAELAEAGVPVLVNLRWPERARDADPEADESLSSLRNRTWAPSTPKALHEAGVSFAFYSGGVASPRDVMEHVRKAVDAGLPSDAALRALTLGPAEIYGVADRLGSVERGKIANLVVTDGDIFDEESKVKIVFVEGRKYEKPEAEQPEEPPAVDLTGTWTLTVESPRGTQESTAELAMKEDGTLSGSVRGQRGEGSVTEGWVSGNRFSFTVAMTMGGRSMEAGYTGTVEGDEMEGSVSYGRFSVEFNGAKTAGPESVAAVAPAPPETPTPAEAAPDRAQPADGPDLAIGAMAMVDWDAPPPTLVIQNATVMTVTQGTLAGASVLIRDGKITALGTDIRAPRGATVIDASGKYVTPGVIDAHGHLASDATNEMSLAVSSMVRIEDVINASDINIYREAAGGVTTSHVLHGSANPIGGQNAMIKHRWGEDAEGLLFEGALPTIKFALGENVKRSNFTPPPGTPSRYPETRMGAIDVIRQAFIDAREYRQRWADYERRRRSERNLVPPARDLQLEPLVEVLEGRRVVHAHAYRADEMLQMIRVAQEFGFHIATFVHGLEAYKLADEIAASGFGVSTFSDWWAYKMEAYDAIPYNAALLTRRGVLVSINSDSQEEARHLNQEAGKTMKWGSLSEDEALALVTLNPAIQLGIDDRVGSIEVGKDADLVIWENYPLSAYAKCLATIVDGRIVFDVERDRERQEMIAAEKDALRAMMGESESETDESATGEPGQGGASNR